MHHICIESHTRHQKIHIEHVNNREAYHQDNYKNCAHSIMTPTDIFIVINDKMDHAKIACPCYARKLKATNTLFKLHVVVTCLHNHLHVGSLWDMRCALHVYVECPMSSIHLNFKSNLCCLCILVITVMIAFGHVDVK